ncbi:MAG: cyclic pyranopterin monophosphate synthase MoaC [Elusimicrobia bacterium]|nr:cyclic pyranopterin monophosphate synthase MoaC [Elusimicrobiota bacterium]
MNPLTHLDSSGRVRMVDVGAKPATPRTAVACGEIRMRPGVLRRIKGRSLSKGDALTVAKIAGIMAAKRTPELIALCHGVHLDSIEVAFSFKRGRLRVQATARAFDRTGVEMEALTAVSVACLAVYDMAKAGDRGMVIGPIYLLEKEGGRGGHFRRGGRP